MAFQAHFAENATHRLVPARYAGDTAPLATLPLPASVVADLTRLAAATDERRQAEQGRALWIGPGELLEGVPEAWIVNSAFCHPGPDGGRFHDHRRGAWYAGVEVETSLAEVAFHKGRFLEDARFSGSAPFEYQDFLADFAGAFSHLDASECSACLLPHPVPQCYAPGQSLANTLLYAGASGVVYSSVRKPGGTCIVCFRPALVFYPRRGSRFRITLEAGVAWDGSWTELPVA